MSDPLAELIGTLASPDRTDSLVRPDRDALPSRPTTRFAPAPTGHLHLGHLVNAIYSWGIARATGGRVLLRIEDHDRQRSRSSFEAELLDDLERLGLLPDEPALDDLRAGPSDFRQSDCGTAYEAALTSLRDQGRVYACDCSRSTYFRVLEQTGHEFSGPGCPGRCRGRGPSEGEGTGLRVALGEGEEAWSELLGDRREGDPTASGDLLIRDRSGNWTYPFCVVVDDQRHGVDLVVRGRDLLHATAPQVRLGRLLGRETPPTFLHHPLIRRKTGEKLSKAAADTSVRSLLDAGRTPAELLGLAAVFAGLVERPGAGGAPAPGVVPGGQVSQPLEPGELARLFA